MGDEQSEKINGESAALMKRRDLLRFSSTLITLSS